MFPFFLFQKVRQMPLDEVVIVDADTNVVESPFDDVSQLPADAVSHFLIHQVYSLFLVTLNFGTKKNFGPYFRPRFSSKLKLKIAQSRVSHLGRVVQSWVKITQG